MRYASDQYGENPTAHGIFTTGDTVTIEVFNAKTPAAGPLSLSSAACVEIQRAAPPHTGRFVWDSSNLSSQPTDFTELHYIMTNQNGRQHDGKLVIGGYPSDSAKRRFQQRVWIDTASAYSGTDFDIGTPEKPVNNVADARTIANREGLKAYRIKGSITLTVDHEDWEFEGVTPSSDIVTVQSPASVDRSTFSQIGIRGDLSGDITAEQCIIGTPITTVTGLSGTFTECGFDGIIRPEPAPGRIQGLRMSALSTSILSKTTYLDYNGGLCVVLGELKGIWAVRNMTAPSCVLALSLAGCQLTLESTITAGNIILISDGASELDDQKTGASTFENYLLQGTDLQRVTHLNGGTILIDKTTDPWQVVHYEDVASGAAEVQRYSLYDGDLQPINNANPLTDFVGVRLRA